MPDWKKLLRSQNWKVILLLVVATGSLCAPIYFHRITVPVDTDYGTHVAFTQQLLAGQELNTGVLSHPVIQLVLAGMVLASGGRLGPYGSLIILQVLTQAFTALILYFYLGQGQRRGWDWLRAGVALTLTFVGPIMLLAFKDGLFFYGYVGLANYHNPTIHLLKPFALLSFLLAVRAVSGQMSRWGGILASALLIMLAAWIKPNYTLSILAALGLVILIRLLQRSRVDWKLLLFGFYLPGLLTLGLQWWIAYSHGDPGTGIVWAPFQVESAYSHDLALKFLLSVLFPLVVLVLARRSLLKDSDLLVAWAGFLAGAAQFYLLAEGGDRMYHANFRWSAQVMLFLLFAAAARWFFRQGWLEGRIRLLQRWIANLTYLAHLAGGIAYYIYCMVSIHYR